MQSQREYVLRTVEERGVRFIQLWFTDVLGIPKTFSITPAELENALDEGMTFDGSAIDGFSRVQESDVLAKPDPKTFQILPFRIGREGDSSPVARVFCDISNLDGSPFEGCPRHVLRRTARAGPRPWVLLLRRARDRVLLLRPSEPGEPPKPLDAGSYFELTVADLADRPAQAHRAHPRGHGHPRRVRPARGRAEPARDRPALHRRPDDGRHDHDRPARRQGDRAGTRRARHASCRSRSRVCRARACTRTSRSSRATERLLRPGRRARAVGGRPPVHRRAPRARTRDHRGHEPVGELLQASRRRLRGAGQRLAGPTTTARRSCACRSSSAARPSRPGSSTAPRTRPATPISPSR